MMNYRKEGTMGVSSFIPTYEVHLTSLLKVLDIKKQNALVKDLKIKKEDSLKINYILKNQSGYYSPGAQYVDVINCSNSTKKSTTLNQLARMISEGLEVSQIS